jgi:hypothetical protein
MSQMNEINKTNQMSDPNFLVITGLSDTVTDTDALFASTNPKGKLFPLVNNVPQVNGSRGETTLTTLNDTSVNMSLHHRPPILSFAHFSLAK